MTRRPTGYAYLDQAPAVLAMAHRGGAKHPDLLGWENTAAAFEHAWNLGYRYLETDVHVTRDGVLVAFHDEVLDRVTDRVGRVAEQRYVDLAQARVGGRHPIPRLDELLEQLPEARFNIDLKSGGAVDALVGVLDGMNAHDRVCVGSFDESLIRRFRRIVGARVATACGPVAVGLTRAGLPTPRILRDAGAVLQVPYRRGGLAIVTAAFVERAHAAGRHVHVWTIDDPTEIDQLLALGVDGIITDRTDLVAQVFADRGLWP